MKFDGYHLQPISSSVVKKMFLVLKNELILLLINLICQIHSYGVLVSYRWDITKYE